MTRLLTRLMQRCCGLLHDHQPFLTFSNTWLGDTPVTKCQCQRCDYTFCIPRHPAYELNDSPELLFSDDAHAR